MARHERPQVGLGPVATLSDDHLAPVPATLQRFRASRGSRSRSASAWAKGQSAGTRSKTRRTDRETSRSHSRKSARSKRSPRGGGRGTGHPDAADGLAQKPPIESLGKDHQDAGTPATTLVGSRESHARIAHRGVDQRIARRRERCARGHRSSGHFDGRLLRNRLQQRGLGAGHPRPDHLLDGVPDGPERILWASM